MRHRIIRPSSLPSWQDCPRRTVARVFGAEAREYFTLRSLPSAIGAGVGSGVHAGAAFTLSEKMTTGDLGPEDAATDAAVEILRERVDDEGAVYDNVTPNIGTAEKQTVRMTITYRTYLAPQIEPVAVEERLEADLDDEWTVSGQTDAIGAREEGQGGSRLRDLKTGVSQRANAAQYGAYSLLFRGGGYEVTGIIEDYLQRVALSKPVEKPESIPIPVEAAEYEALAVIEDMKHSFERFEGLLSSGKAPPETAFRANPSSVLCGEKWCPAWGTEFCRVHKGAK